MKFARRQFLRLAGGAVALPAVARGAFAALDYPTQPVRILVGFAPGGTTDVVARLIGQYLSERLGQPFVVENRPGAGTNIATEEVLRAPARRLHAASGHGIERDQRLAVQESQLQFSAAMPRRSPASCRCPTSWR